MYPNYPPKLTEKDRERMRRAASEMARLMEESGKTWADMDYKDICQLIKQAYKNTKEQ